MQQYSFLDYYKIRRKKMKGKKYILIGIVLYSFEAGGLLFATLIDSFLLNQWLCAYVQIFIDVFCVYCSFEIKKSWLNQTVWLLKKDVHVPLHRWRRDWPVSSPLFFNVKIESPGVLNQCLILLLLCELNYRESY